MNPGLNADSVLTFRVSLPSARYRDAAQRLQFFERAMGRLRALPGVRAAASINFLPFQGLASGTSVHVGGRRPARPGQESIATIRTVMPGYFAAMGIPILQGRDFDQHDNSLSAPYRFIVNETLARRFLAGEDPLTKTIRADMQRENPYGEIIGVVGDVKEGSVDHAPEPTVYYNEAHMGSGSMVFVLRAHGDPMSLAGPAGSVIRDLDGAQPVADIAPMQTVVSETFARQRFSAVLLIGFSVIAVMLAAIGIYGVLAYSVAERTREIGIRVALGADAARVIAMVAAGGARVVGLGTVAGMAGAFLLTGLLKSMLFGVEPHDVVTFVAVPCVLGLVAMMAAYLPARRASQVAPADALRSD
ncbi:MAG TPA: FtsX-like permease family protein [Candidatus Acidoferrum sp.]|nr:FtsX-like permease family protein [Candidatus Acidoferrum sp.]